MRKRERERENMIKGEREKENGKEPWGLNFCADSSRAPVPTPQDASDSKIDKSSASYKESS